MVATQELFMPEFAAPFMVAVCATVSLVIFAAGGASVLAHVPARNRPD